jgi:hypothetical protein
MHSIFLAYDNVNLATKITVLSRFGLELGDFAPREAVMVMPMICRTLSSNLWHLIHHKDISQVQANGSP